MDKIVRSYGRKIGALVYKRSQRQHGLNPAKTFFLSTKTKPKKESRDRYHCSICHSFHRIPRDRNSRTPNATRKTRQFSSRNFIILGSIQTYRRAYRSVFGNAKKQSAMCRCTHRQVPRMIRKKAKIEQNQPEQSKWTYKICRLVPFKFSPVRR